ncbi:MAG: sulfur carrier protein ThiS [Lachnospiraceae bacterium]|nr:sulfur carrier protein ThiS [Lachnospiraceae bacterium]
MVKINGQEFDCAGQSISKMLEEQGYNAPKVAVEVNFSIVPKANFEEYILKDGDSVEVVHFVGGG